MKPQVTKGILYQMPFIRPKKQIPSLLVSKAHSLPQSPFPHIQDGDANSIHLRELL